MHDAPYQLLPPLSPEDYAALEADIIARGVLVPVEYDEHGKILDGHHRVQICESLGLVDWPRFVRKGMSEEDKRAHARALNLSRRHLTTAQKREVIEAQLKETPAISSRALAARFGVSDKTVGSVRRNLEATAEIPQLDKTEGKDGRMRAKPIRTMFLPEKANVPELKAVAKAIRGAEQKERHAVRTDMAEQIAARSDASPWWHDREMPDGGAFSVIYADPPWRFQKYSEVTGGEKSPENHYPTMSLEDIKALGCPASKQAVLFLWVTDLANGIDVMRAWGFDYKSFWGWKKIYPGRQTGTGYWGFDNLELLLIGTRGAFPAPIQGTQPIKCTDHAIGCHSQKPAWFAEQIDRLFPDARKLEMFQRRDSLTAGDIRIGRNWAFWGNQAGAP